MSVEIGFAILSYNEPQQLLRLVKTLSAMFSAPPIVCHHNFDQCALDESLFPPNVRFVHPHIVTQWGHVTTPLAALRALDLLRKHDQPDWFVLLSGSDYPVRPASEILAELSYSDYDAYLDHREVPYDRVPSDQTAPEGFGRPGWIPLAYDRYCAYHFWWPRFSKELLSSGAWPFQGQNCSIWKPKLIRWLVLNRPERIFGGCFWFEANRKAVNRLLDDPSLQNRVRYFGKREIPEEALFHTVLCNHADLRICRGHKRFENWNTTDAHPHWLELSDVPTMIASGAHFARKFRPDGIARDFLDQTVLKISACA